MTIQLNNTTRTPSTSLSCSTEQDALDADKATRLSPSRENPVHIETAVDSTLPTAASPHVVEPDHPSNPLNASFSPYEGIKRHHSRRGSNCSQDNDDGDSVASTASLGTQISANVRDSKRQHAMKVHFADKLISKVFTRPKTLPEDKSSLHYTFEEMDEFREEYYRFCEEQEEKMLLDELANSSSDESTSLIDGYPTDCSVFSETSSVTDAHLIDDDADHSHSRGEISSSCNNSPKHSIFKVLVTHNDISKLCPSRKVIEAGGSCAAESKISNSPEGGCPVIYTASSNDGDAFFDNPAFWNGSLTWY